MLKSKPTLWLLLAVALYSVAQLAWYLQTPMGQSPVLDGRENLQLADQIAAGELAEEPFYRAMLYPAILAIFPFHWAVLGLAAHLLNTYLCYRIALQFWRSPNSALVSGALVGFNPVLLHFAFDPLDITLAISFFLVGMTMLAEALSPSRLADRVVAAAGIGFFFALATLARPHFMSVLVIFAVGALILTLRRKIEWQRGAAFALAAAIPLCIYGFVQLSHSGSFRIMPWQGAYNLWASNKPGASGLYLQQSIELHHLGDHQNPTRVESEELYRRETGLEPTIEDASAYWRQKTLQSIRQEPWSWVKLMTFKTYALVNNFEQYNNKTYSFHKRMSPWLRYNPISFGILLILAVASVAALRRQVQRQLTHFLIVAGAYALGLLLYMVSARFRLPLTPLLAILAGGLPLAYNALLASSKQTKRTTAIAAGVAAIVTFSFFGGINSKKTYLQDTLLLADASASLGRDAEALAWAELALSSDPNANAARRLRLVSRYNLVASGAVEATPAFWLELGEDILRLPYEDEVLAYIEGLMHWNMEEHDQALRSWRSGYEKYGMDASSCLAAILLVDPEALQFEISAELIAELQAPKHRLLGFAIAQHHAPERRQSFLDAIGMSEQRYQSIEQSMQRVLKIP